MTGGTNNTNGYTIVETLIFLAVSGALMVSVMTVIGGQQARTQFNQGIRQLQSEFDETINDVATGYYTRSGNINCQAPAAGGKPTFPAGTRGIGENLGCIFLGRVIHLGSDGAPNSSEYSVYTAVGRQFKAGILSELVTSYNEAEPIRLPANATQREIPHGITIASARYDDGSGPFNTGAIGFYAALGQYDEEYAGQKTVIVAFNGTSAGQNEGDINTAIATVANYVENPSIQMCFNSGTTDQHGLITIGSVQGRLGSELVIGSGSCP